jgi:N-acetylmuramoyl-L-alanine amidase
MGKVVVIDPGHGDHDGGAYGSYSKEKDIVLKVSKLIAEILSPYVTPFLTRDDDTFLSLSTRPDLANAAKANRFISIHCNAADNDSARGWEVFTTPGQNNSDKLATAIGIRYSEVNPSMKKRFDESDGDLDKEANFAVIKGTDCPSCLFELGFISNKDEENLLNNPSFQLDAANAIACGILDSLGIVPDQEINTKLPESPLVVEVVLTTYQRLDLVEKRLDAGGL